MPLKIAFQAVGLSFLLVLPHVRNDDKPATPKSQFNYPGGGPDKKHYFLSSAPLVDANAVYFGSWDGYLYAINRKDGTLRWRHRPDVNHEHVGAAITDGKRLYVTLDPLFDFEKQVDKEGIHGIAAVGMPDE